MIFGLGAGAHYEKWGYTLQQILEKDWGDKTEVKPTSISIWFKIITFRTEDLRQDKVGGFRFSFNPRHSIMFLTL